MLKTNQEWLESLSNPGQMRESALAELRQLLVGRLRRSLWHRPGVDLEFVEDNVQDSLIRILQVLPQFEGRSQFTTWATTIAIRTALSSLRRKQWRDVSLDEMIHSARSPIAANDDPGVYIEQDGFVGKMYQIINNDLTDKQRIALIAELKGMPQQEIGRQLGSNRNAVYKLTHDARKRLKSGLENAGYSAADLSVFER